MWIYIAIFTFFWIIFYLVSLSVTYSRKKKLTEEKKKYFKELLKQIEIQTESKQKIIDYDKLYHKILLELWYKWDFWSILKTSPIVISDINKIWELHKFRNKLVHDFDSFSVSMLSKNEKEYEVELKKLLE
jgi:hypothetical protein